MVRKVYNKGGGISFGTSSKRYFYCYFPSRLQDRTEDIFIYLSVLTKSVSCFLLNVYISFLFCAPWVSLLRQICAHNKFIIIIIKGN